MAQVDPPIEVPPHIHRRRNRGRGQMMVAGRYRKSDGFPDLIDDVYPSIQERLYGAEKDIDTINREFRDHREESIRHGERWATKEHLGDLEKDMIEKFAGIIKRLDKRENFQILQTIGLIASLLYAVILSYKHFIQP